MANQRGGNRRNYMTGRSKIEIKGKHGERNKTKLPDVSLETFLRSTTMKGGGRKRDN